MTWQLIRPLPFQYEAMSRHNFAMFSQNPHYSDIKTETLENRANVSVLHLVDFPSWDHTILTHLGKEKKNRSNAHMNKK